MRGVSRKGVIILYVVVLVPRVIHCANDSVTCGVAAFTKNLTKFDVIVSIQQAIRL